MLNSVLGLALVGAGTGSWVTLHGGSKGPTVTRTSAVVQRGTVQATVTGSGNLLPISQIDVSFDSGVASQQVAEIAVKVGDRVAKGQTLARIDDRTVQSALSVARLNVATAQANFDKARSGLTEDAALQLSIAEASAAQAVTNAETSLANSRATIDLGNASQAETMRQARLAFDNANLTAERDLATAQSSYDAAAAALVIAQAAGNANDIVAKTTALATQETALVNARLKHKQALDGANNALTNARNNQATSQLKDAQTLQAAERQVETAKTAQANTLASNAIKRKPPADLDITSQQIALINAQTALATAERNAAAASLLAPAAGTVTSLTGKVGSNASATGSGGAGAGGANATASTSTAFLQISDVTAYEVKVGFSEADAAKVKAQQNANITVEAAGNARLAAKVRSVDGISSVVNNVVTYNAYLSVTSLPAGVTLQPGLTATVSVVVQEAANVLLLPTSAVPTRGVNATVKVAADAAKLAVNSAKPITLGLRGDNTIEVQTGLAEGDVVVTERVAVSTAQTPTTAAGGTLGGAGGAVVPGAGGAGFGAGGAGGGAGGAGANRGGGAGGAGAAAGRG